MIQKLLIANRGEIACRIMRTCQKRGIRTVAVFSDADRGALHVEMADEAVRLGPADAASSYLNVDAILDAARRTGADGIHPGYGFLSERIALAEGCARDGIVWVGPSPRAIEMMGSKIESKRIAETAGVPCVPGYHGADQDDDALEEAAKKIGFPVLIKASAGGGGRGMRRVEDPKELRGALALARAEAAAGFGDPSLLIERLIKRPRHIEVQLAGDKHGNLVHLFERECSIQRNYQKVIEEAPAPNLAPEIRNSLYDAALKLGHAIGYDSLGTVEFILDADGDGPWFLEMNTRLQVEHPVTELITGFDLVEWQIRIADGETLPVAQTAITASGAAIEARLNAEDPAHDYRPSFGTVSRFETPERDGVRVDSGIRAGSQVTPHYDSMLAKIIGYGLDRDTAAARLSDALCDVAIFGIETNQPFLRDLVDSTQFRAGALTTRFIAEVFPDGWTGDPIDGPPTMAVAAAAWADAREREADALGPWSALGGFRVTEPAGRPAHIVLLVEASGTSTEIELTGNAGRYRIEWAEGAVELAVGHDDAGLTITTDGMVRHYNIGIRDDQISLARGGRYARHSVKPAIERAGARAETEATAGGARVTATLPGLVSAIPVMLGQEVALGDTVVVIEAMKLMHALPALTSGRVNAIFCQPGETVAAGAVLVEIEAGDAAAAS